LRRLGRRGGLLEVLEAELQLVRVEPLRPPTEPPALQLPDQEAQLLDLGLRRIPLGQNSISLDLESTYPGVLSGNDFMHTLQLL